jgi:hypothetical protein
VKARLTNKFISYFPENSSEDQDALKDYSEEEKERFYVARRMEIARVLMKMNLSTDSNGFLYFNELLHATLKRAFAKEIFASLNKTSLLIMNKAEKKLLAKFQEKTQKVNIHIYI